ncbi:hypothetical protein L210DRAFT_672263, partial [Boletus edulis BED1]
MQRNIPSQVAPSLALLLIQSTSDVGPGNIVHPVSWRQHPLKQSTPCKEDHYNILIYRILTCSLRTQWQLAPRSMEPGTRCRYKTRSVLDAPYQPEYLLLCSFIMSPKTKSRHSSHVSTAVRFFREENKPMEDCFRLSIRSSAGAVYHAASKFEETDLAR